MRHEGLQGSGGPPVSAFSRERFRAEPAEHGRVVREERAWPGSARYGRDLSLRQLRRHRREDCGVKGRPVNF